MTTETQNAQILARLKSGKTITPLEALAEFGCLRLSGRIYDLRRDGHQIEDTVEELAILAVVERAPRSLGDPSHEVADGSQAEPVCLPLPYKYRWTQR